MIPNGIYLLTIVEADRFRDGLRIEFDVDLEDERVSKIFATKRPAASLRNLLRTCGKKVRGRVRLNLDSLVGLECMGMVIGGQVIEFYLPGEVGRPTPGWWNEWAVRAIPNYVM